MTYLSAELGAGGRIAREMRPEPLPEGWNEYLEDVWDAWALTLDRLESADEPMAVDEIASSLKPRNAQDGGRSPSGRGSSRRSKPRYGLERAFA
jgi:hypothetical protein